MKLNFHPLVIRKDSGDIEEFRKVFLTNSLFKNKFDFQPMTIIDSAAGVGYSSLFFHYQFPKARIVAIELSDLDFNVLQKNTQNLSSIRRFKSCLWHTKTKVNLIQKTSGGQEYEIQAAVNPEDFEIESETVESIMKEKNWTQLDLLKVSLENSGFEIFTKNYENWIDKVKVFIFSSQKKLPESSLQLFINATSGIKFKQFQNEFGLIFIKEVEAEPEL